MNERDQTADLLRAIPGGLELLVWFDGVPNFGDAEVIGLYLDRRGTSRLVIDVPSSTGGTMVTFVLADWIDVHVNGFSHQNVIDGLELRRAKERDIRPWEAGVGVVPGDIEMELRPCFGAYGTIRARLTLITLEPRGPSANEVRPNVSL